MPTSPCVAEAQRSSLCRDALEDERYLRAMDAGQVALLPVTFIEERGGGALVRLPNGSKTTVAFGALDPLALRAHFVPEQSGSGVTTHCGTCDWSRRDATWPSAVDALRGHYATAHQDPS